MNDMKAAVIKVHAPDIAPRYRHPTIMNTFDELKPGQLMVLTNDHDPKPLKYQLMIEREGTFSWEYIEAGPERWEVNIKKKQ